uniref:Hyccin n=1 Tax=Panagrolaimus sp. JU765 TaxID=591449 RepID=A0AC34RDV3_9BILA
MNSDQLQDWLSEISENFRQLEERAAKNKALPNYQKILGEQADSTQLLINYLMNNYENVGLIQPLVAQILSVYYKIGLGRIFVLQLIPSLITTYLLGIAKRQKQSISMLETFFMAVYNEEILAGGPTSDQMNKKVEEVRIPSLRYPSIYHDPAKMNPYPEITQIRPNSGALVQNVVKMGPFPAVELVNAENRYMVLTRILKALNNSLCHMARSIICRTYCLSVLVLAKSGFSFPESDFRHKILHDHVSDEDFGDHSKKPRIPLSSYFLIEALNGIYYALFNGTPDLALRALDAIHSRAQYDLLQDVLLVTNAIRNDLKESDTVQMMLEIDVQFTTPTKTSPTVANGVKKEKIMN